MTVRILTGDCRDVLRTLADESVQCVVTSPPYFGLRDYGVAGQIGLEPTPEAFVAELVAVFREVRRVLRKDGTLWLNLGDSYANNWDGGGGGPSSSTLGSSDGKPGRGVKQWNETARGRKRIPVRLKPKDLIGIPWRVAFALQADGWWLRQDIIWSKPNPMPESVTDRCTKAHEYLFLLTRSERYYFDADAIAEPSLYPDDDRKGRSTVDQKRMPTGTIAGVRPGSATYETRNRRSVWTVATQPFPGSHFAVFPPDLITPCIKAGTSVKGCCAACGAPWVRETERSVEYTSGSGRAGNPPIGKYAGTAQTESGSYDIRMGPSVKTTTLGWSPSCQCAAAVVPCTVLDPFSGAGTTGLVADRLQRNAILIELNPEYAAMARRRIDGDAPLFNDGRAILQAMAV